MDQGVGRAKGERDLQCECMVEIVKKKHAHARTCYSILSGWVET